MPFARKKSSFQGWGHSGWYLSSKQPLAATCGHLRPLAPAATCPSCGHLRPLAAPCGHLRPLVATCGHLRPLAATRVAASGCKWLQMMQMMQGTLLWKFQILPVEQPATCGHVRPLAATCGYSSGCKSFFFEFPIPHVLRPQ